MVSIIGGKNKKTKIEVPKELVRPTSSKKRESIFSILESTSLKNNNNIYKDQFFLDLFAGTGALGLEAISRGAKFCYFFESSEKVINILKNNCIKICKNNNFQIIKEDLNKSNFSIIINSISVIFIDPPYEMNVIANILKSLLKNNLISKKTIIVAECEINTVIEVPTCLNVFNEKFYGKTKILFIKKTN
ncbi:MAG: Ribosomal RNA small subunit methyltransferase D [Alphaproteobacteria bacterium MarineAlpha5_Bin6]|nr:MAG: Ribosomal RNA small subunit methyltransferase D [Alphaproteobacteria bacterium MarineAlpha5_Bin7]PPR54666.1 MAG: Ribosomal RNA small subunit methyltransferase D [Alphaproteobacteria bacterium MarineAlpha5_Bin6]|tara:strand:- start:7659 stop:8228 length:570 start_codon:yes stop_codon:yes gene_type:complete